MYTILVKNSSDKPIPGASVTFTRAGAVLVALKTGADGTVQIDPEFDGGLLEAGVLATASASGYKDLGIDASLITPNWYFQLNSAPKTALLVAGGIAGGLLLGGALLKRKKGRRVGDAAPAPAERKAKWLTPVLVGGGILALYVVNKLFGGDPSRGHLPDAAASELDKLAAQGIYPTITDTDAESMASKLVQAFDDCGTDMGAVEAVFSQLSNRADVLKLIKIYGIRDFKGCFDGDYFSMHSYNLAQALSSELSTSNYADINKILSDNGVNYTF